MKTLFLAAALLALAPLSPAADTVPEPVTAEYIISNIEALNAVQTDVINLLKEVHDKDSADAAAPKIEAMTAGMAEMNAKLQGLKVPASVMQEVKTHFESQSAEMQATIAELQKTLATLLNTKPAAFYGSDKLFAAMNLKPAETAQAETSDISYEDALREAKDFVGSIKEYNRILKGVTDKSSADAAAEPVRRITMHLKALMADGPAFAHAPADVAAKLNEQFEGGVVAAVQAANDELSQTMNALAAQNFYGSAELVSAISAAAEQ